MKKKIAVIFGTRPEAIKLAPVIHELRKFPNRFEIKVITTGQHREMLDQTLPVFGIKPDKDLDIMRVEQSLFNISVDILNGLHGEFEENGCPDWVMVQGDTTTTFMAGLCAFFQKVPVAHVEAGLRTGLRYNPFPEEMNRKLTGCLADLHFAPTGEARDNLIREGYPGDMIHVTGNTSIDALVWVRENTSPSFKESGLEDFLNDYDKIILATTHRRESFGLPMENTMRALVSIAKNTPSAGIVLPVHFNPNVRKQVGRRLVGKNNILLVEPLDYINFVHLMDRSTLILTDSGGVQEEAPSLGKPVLVLRESTERPEGIKAGTAKLVGTDIKKITGSVHELLGNEEAYKRMSQVANPYGDGLSSRRIADILFGAA